MEPGVLNAFAYLWVTDELLASFDALNITLPNRKDVPRKPAWEYIDQSHLRRGMHCVQAIINLSLSGPEDGGLVVYPRSHKLNDGFFNTQTKKSSWKPKDLYMFEREQLQWFIAKGIQPHKFVLMSEILFFGIVEPSTTEANPRSSAIKFGLLST